MSTGHNAPLSAPAEKPPYGHGWRQNALFRQRRGIANTQLEGRDITTVGVTVHENGVQQDHEDLDALLRLLSRPTPHTPATLAEIQTDITGLTAAIQELSLLNAEHRANSNGVWWTANSHRYVSSRNELIRVIDAALNPPRRYWHDRHETENVPVSDRLTSARNLITRTIQPNGNFTGGDTAIADLDQKLTEALQAMQRHRSPRAARSFTEQVDYDALEALDGQLRPLLDRVALEPFWRQTGLGLSTKITGETDATTVGERAHQIAVELESAVRMHSYDAVEAFDKKLSLLARDMARILAEHHRRPQGVEFHDDRWMLPRIGRVHMSIRTALFSLLAGAATVGGLYKYSGSPQAPAPGTPAAGAPSAPAASNANRTPEQSFDIQRVAGFSVYREGSELHFKFPLSFRQDLVAFSIEQPANTSKNKELLSLSQKGNEWVCTIDPVYMQNGSLIKISPQFYKGETEGGWVRGESIEIPLK